MSEQRATARELLPSAAQVFTDRVHAIPAERWSNPTPCTLWTVRDLLNHVTGEHLWVPHLLGGQSLAEVGDRYDGDVLGASPVAVWDAAIEESLKAWAGVSDEDTVQLSFGSTHVSEYAEQMLLDLTVHGWDLARGAKLDDRMNPESVDRALAYARGRVDQWRGSGMFAPAVAIASDDPQARLLGLVGRQP